MSIYTLSIKSFQNKISVTNISQFSEGTYIINKRQISEGLSVLFNKEVDSHCVQEQLNAKLALSGHNFHLSFGYQTLLNVI